MPKKSIAITAFTIMLIFILFAITWVEYSRAKVKSNIAIVKRDFHTISEAMSVYGMDNNTCPIPDIDTEGNRVLSHRLIYSWTASTGWIHILGQTTAIWRITPAGHYLEKLLYDPFNNHGKGLYHYSNLDWRGEIGWTDWTWIVSSYGPDEVSGYGSTKFIVQQYVADPKFFKEEDKQFIRANIAPFPLKSSPFTYDPTNGLTSGGDIWRRGP